MSSRKELSDNELFAISGGVDFNPDKDENGKNLPYGSIGYTDGALEYRYDNYTAVYDYISAHKNDKNWSGQKEYDDYMLKGMLSENIIHQ